MLPAVSVLRLVNVLETIEGRKKLHKIIHILQRTGFDNEFTQEYGYLHYGPYSEDVSYELASLAKQGLINEAQRDDDAHSTYVYTNTERNRALLKEIKRDAAPAWADRAKELNKKPAQELEAISTILFLKRNGFDGDRLRTRFSELKPNLKTRYADALHEAERLAKSK